MDKYSTDNFDLQKDFKNISSHFEGICNDVKNKIEAKYLLWLIYELATNDINLRSCYLSKSLTNPNNLNLNTALQVTLIKYASHINDLPWNSKMFPRLRPYLTSEHNQNKELKMSLNLLTKVMIDEIVITTNTKLHQMNALTYSKLISNNTIPDNLNQPILVHIYSFLNTFEKKFLKLLENHNESLTIKTYINIICSLMIINRLLKMSQSNLFIGKKFNENIIDLILLHFKWVEKYCLSQFEYQPQFNHLSSHSHSLDEIRKYYLKKFVKTTPLYEENQIEFHRLSSEFGKLNKFFAKYGEIDSNDVLRRLSIISTDKYLSARNLLQQTSSDLTLDNLNAIEIVLNEIKSIDSTVNQHKLDLIPLMEYFALKGLKNVDVINEDFYKEIPTITYDVLNVLQSDVDKSKCCELTHSFELNSIVLRNSIIYSKNNNDVVEMSVNGPILTNIGLSMLLDRAGELKSVGLIDMAKWKENLKKTQCVLWGNVGVFSEQFDFW